MDKTKTKADKKPAKRRKKRKPTIPKPVGRPKDPTVIQRAELVLESISNGVSMAQSCREIGIPPESVYALKRESPEFSERYERARQCCIDVQVDQVEEMLAQEPDAAWARVKLDALKWKSGKLHAKKYGERVGVEHTGKDGGPIEITKVEWSVMGDEDNAG